MRNCTRRIVQGMYKKIEYYRKRQNTIGICEKSFKMENESNEGL